MKWISDPTRRFVHRPLYELSEIENECEDLIRSFFRARGTDVESPLSTANLSLLLESRTSRCDFGRDLSSFGEDVEGVTVFSRTEKPVVYISNRLREQSLARRRRMTLAHELGHVHFHNVLFNLDPGLELFSEMRRPGPTYCKRETISSGGDWMEWQAAFAGGAILMPWSSLRSVVEQQLSSLGVNAPLSAASSEALHVIKSVATRFEASVDAARVRLVQRGVIDTTNNVRLNLS